MYPRWYYTIYVLKSCPVLLGVDEYWFATRIILTNKTVTMKKLFLLLALLGIVATGCSKDEVDKGNDNKTEQPNENEGGNQVEDYVFVTDSQNNYSVVANGGEIVVTVATNIEYSVAIPAEAQSWISVAVTRAVHMEKLTFIITKNEANAERRAVVKLIGGDKSELQSITFIQQGKSTEIEIPDDTTETIKFSDADTKLICISYWDTNDDGELSYKEAAAVTDLGTAFKGSSIMAFTELKYFTGLSGITDNAFDGCVSLVKITLPEQITSIGNSAFNGCNNLKNIDIPDSVTSIGDYAFRGCSSLTSVTIPDSVTTIGGYTFEYCSSLTSVTIGDSVTTMGNYAFWGCKALTSVTIGDSVTTMGDYAFYYCESLTSVTIGDSLTTIGYAAFYRCSSLTSITIPDNVTTIGDYAFWYCSRLTSVYCKAITPPVGYDEMFNYGPSGRTIYVPKESVNKYISAQGWSRYKSFIVGYNF